MSVKITAFTAENFKRIRAVAFHPTADGVTVIGGKNAEGKTSVLDAIAFALGGAKYKPVNPTRDGAASPGKIELTLSNGLVVTRKGKNASLTVTDPTGCKAGQALLDSFVSTFALDLPKFLAASDKDKVTILLNTMGIQEALDAADREVKAAYDRRADAKRYAAAASARVESLPFYEDVPEVTLSIDDLKGEIEAVRNHNRTVDATEARVKAIEREAGDAEWSMKNCDRQIAECSAQIEELKKRIDTANLNKARALEEYNNLMKQAKEIEIPERMSDTALMEQMAKIGEINAKISANATRREAEEEEATLQDQVKAEEAALETARKKRLDLVDPDKMPVRGLTYEDGLLCYHGHPWSEMSGAEQLIVATAIVRKTNPECGFVLVDKLEQMDVDTLNNFGAWAEKEGIQIIATRVSTGKECTLVIEDGENVQEDAPAAEPEEPDYDEF